MNEEVVRGRFTIDLARAREKLGRYQLADPYAYILEFIKAAVLRNAEEIDIFVDTDDLTMKFGGTSFDKDELHNLELAVLEQAVTDRQRSRQRMAMGLLAVQSLKPARLKIEGRSGHKWEQRKDKAGSLSAGRPTLHNLIHVKMPWTMGALLDRFRKRQVLRPEEVLLQEHCQAAQIRIVLNGKNLSQRAVLERDHLGGVAIEGNGLRGLGGLVPGRPAELTLVVSGVQVEVEPLDLGKIPFRAVVEGTKLSTDISGTSVQRDEAYIELMEAVRSARGRSISLLANEDAERYTDEIKEELLSLPDFNVEGDLEQYPTSLMKCPIWKFTDGRPCSLLDLQSVVEAAGFLPFCVEQHLGLRLEEFEGVLHADVTTKSALHNLTGWSTKNVTRRLRQQAEAQRNKVEWKLRRVNSRLSHNRYLERAPIEAPGVKGELGIKAQPDPALVRIILEGCLLCELTPASWPKGLEVVLEAEFQPLRTYDGVNHDSVSLTALLAATSVMRTLYEVLAEGNSDHSQTVLAEFLNVASRAQPVKFLLEGCDFPVQAYESDIARSEWPSLQAEDESPLLDVAWVKTDGEQRLSVRELQVERQKPELILSENQLGTIERLLGDSFLATNETESGGVAFRLDPAELQEERFLAGLRTELSRVTQESELRLGGFNLSRLVLVTGTASEVFTLESTGSVHLHRSNPLIKEALESQGQDPHLLLLLVSVLFTAVNRASTHVSDQQERTLQGALTEYLVTSPARMNTLVEGEPTGVFEPVCQSGMCTGWARDPSGLGLRLYFGEPTADTKPDAVIPLDSPREEQGHHFLFELPESARDGERLLIHACLVHPTEGILVELDGSPRAFAEPHTEPAKPRGALLEVTDSGLCRGWCVDPNDPAGSPQLEFYLDGHWKEGEWLGLCKAKLADPEWEHLTGFRGAHGFEFQIPAHYRDACRHTLHVYAFDLEKEAGNPLLEGCPFEFFLSAQEKEGDKAWQLGKRALELDDFETAIPELQLRLELGGDQVPDDEVWAWLGAAFSALGHLGKADEAYQNAVKLAPSQSEHWHFHGLVKTRIGQEREALQKFRRAVEIDTDRVDSRIELARREALPQEQAGHWEHLLALRSFPHKAEGAYALCQLYLQLGELEKAEQGLKRAREFEVPDVDELEKKLQEARRLAKELIVSEAPRKTASEEDNELFLVAQRESDQGNFEKALASLKGIAARQRFTFSPSSLWLEVGRANLGLQRLGQAERALKRALVFEPNSAKILCELAQFHVLQSEAESAEDFFLQAVKVDPHSPWVQLAVGNFFLEQGQLTKAIEHLDQCVRFDEDDEYNRVYESLANLYMSVDLPEKASEALSLLHPSTD